MPRWNPTFTEEELANEVWKTIPGYVGLYSASSLGRIRRDAPGPGTQSGRILVQNLSKRTGYLQVTLHKRDGGKTKRVNVVVALTFIGPCPKRKQVNHIDTIKTNNRNTNLEYLTPRENCLHARDHGLTLIGDRHPYRTRPELVPRGDKHWSKRHPGRYQRGSKHYSKRHPEKLLRGEAHGQTRLKEADILEIRRRCAAGFDQRETAKKYGVSQSTIWRIFHKATWGHVQPV